ncbi:DsbA family protein [Streptomyces polyrhachis]|uniref:DsbA family protein n=1 Tax=Streptomyces polyrhachis TaxID=1282885 RepID=A0ABW2G7C2_9ACTN
MSAKNSGGKRAARERMAEQREHQRAAEKRRRTVLAVLSVLGVLVVAGGIAVLVNNNGDEGSESDGPLVYPKHTAGKDRLAIIDGRSAAPVTLTVYEDFRCPACQAFEKTYSKTIHELVDSGQLKAEYRLVTLIDNNLKGHGSLNAANAAACSAGSDDFRAYHDVLYANQPPESTDDYGDKDKLKELAKKVPGLDTKDFADCVDDGRYNPWVVKSDKAFMTSGHDSTPTVLLDGKSIFGQGLDLTPEKLKQQVAAAAKG